LMRSESGLKFSLQGGGKCSNQFRGGKTKVK
jgi:hypothetical protein